MSMDYLSICLRHVCVYCSIIYSSQIMETAQVSICKWMDTKEVVYIYIMDYYSTIKKNEILPTCNNLDGTRMHYAKQKEPHSKNDILYDYIYINLSKRQSYMDENRLVVVNKGWC